MQNAIGTTIYCAWLGGFPSSPPSDIGRLLTLEEVGAIFSGTPLSLTFTVGRKKS